MVITFDFDDTLLWTAVERDADGEYLDHGPIGKNPHVFPRLLDALDSGAEVHLVTSRRSETRPEVLHWLKRWGVLDRLAGVHFTEGRLKHDTLERLGSEQHFDDDPEELAHLPKGCLGVRAPLHDSWTARLDERRYLASSRSVEMRRMRLVAREEQLLRETVRGIIEGIADASPAESQRYLKPDEDALQKKIEDLSLPQQNAFDVMLSVAGISSDAVGLGANWIPDLAPANIPADLASLGIAWVSYARSEMRLDEAKQLLRNDSRVTEEERNEIIQTYDDFAAMQSLLCAASLIATFFSVLDFFGVRLAGFVELGVKIIKIAFSVLSILDELTGNVGSTELYKKMKTALAAANTELTPVGGVVQLARSVETAFKSQPEKMSRLARGVAAVTPGVDEKTAMKMVARMQTMRTWATDFDRRMTS